MIFSEKWLSKRVKNISRVILLSLLLTGNACQALQRAGQDIAQELARELDRAAREMQEANERRIRDNRRQQDQHRQTINRLAAQGIVDPNDPRIQNERDQIAELQEDLKRGDKWEDIGAKAVGGMFDYVIDDFKKEQKKELARDKALVDGMMANKGAKDRLEMTINALRDPRTLAYLAGGTVAVFGVYYSLKLVYQHIEATMGKPTLVRDSSRKGIGELLIDYFMGRDEIEYKLSDIVLSPDVQEKATILAEDTRETREYGLTYQNVMFFGPPGTGKTEFAKIISHYSGMDYAIMSGADFAQFAGGERIAELHKLFDWAKTSPNGLIIFIDEADACFRDRSTLDKDGVNFVNAFLSQTGSGSDKFMIVLATNYEDELDAAVRSRIHKKVPFFLPSVQDRYLITKKKVEKYLIGDNRTFTKDGQEISVHLSVARDVNDDYLQELSTRLDGFSGRDIDQMVTEVRLRAYRSGKNLVTKEIFDAVAVNKKAEIEKDKQTTLYQRERQNAARAQISAAAAVA